MNEIQMAAKLYQARDACKGLPSFEDNMTYLKDLLKQHMARNKKTIMQTLIGVLEASKDSPVNQMWLMAAAVEIIEEGETA